MVSLSGPLQKHLYSALFSPNQPPPHRLHHLTLKLHMPRDTDLLNGHLHHHHIIIPHIPSDVQGFVNPPRVRGKGQKGKGQGKDFLTLDKPLTLVKGQGFSRGFSGVSFL